MIIALPKGVVLHRSLQIIGHLIGQRPNPKQLRFECPGGDQVILVKHRDVPELLAHGLVDIGVTSTDWLEEKGMSFSSSLDLDWCYTQISVITKLGCARYLGDSGEPLVCVTEFPNIAASYIEQRGLRNRVRLLHISGSTEAYIGSVGDVGIDCVETGETLRQNGLVQREVVRNIRTVLAAPRQPLDLMVDYHRIFAEIGSQSK